jgi:hypothetical protein
MPHTADEIRARVEESWGALWEAVEHLGSGRLGEETTAGWTAREMLAHVAFWDEASVPVITYMLRGREIPEGWRFASGYVAGAEWPAADTHNAREAAWAREQPPEAVLERLERAHQELVEALQSVDDAEAAEHSEYFDGFGSHYREHLSELRALLDGAR